MERKKEDRSLLLLILLSVVTCGIYALWFYWVMFKDLNDVCGAKERDSSQKSPNFLVYSLLCFITCGFYGIFWLYKQGNRIQRAGEAYGERIDENGTTLLLWSLLGSLVCGIGFWVGTYLLLKNINTLCRCYNREYADQGGDYSGYMGNGQSQESASYSSGADSSKPSDSSWGALGALPEKDSRREQDVTIGTKDMTKGMPEGMLICTKGTLNGARIPVTDREIITIGRDSALCNLVLTDMDISRRHCTVQFMAAENCYYVTDYSSIGVKLNGYEPLRKSALTKCQRGSKILLGNGNNEFLLQ